MTTNYVGLITPEHADKPNFVATVDQNTRPYTDTQNALASLPQAFDLDTAIGAQEDAVGVRVGISRNVPVPINQGFFAFGDAKRGWGLGFWRGPYAQQFGIQSFDDDTFRLLLRAKIQANAGNGSVGSALQILATFLATAHATYFVYSPDKGATGISNCSPQLVIGFSGNLPAIPYMLVISREYLPLRPAGAKLSTYATSVGGAPIFGFGMQNQYVSGFGTGAWGQDPEALADAGLI